MINSLGNWPKLPTYMGMSSLRLYIHGYFNLDYLQQPKRGAQSNFRWNFRKFSPIFPNLPKFAEI